MNRLAFATLALVLMSAGSAFSADQTVVTTNGDGSTTTTTTSTRYYYANDVNDNGILDSQEFPKYVYHRWDADSDGFLSDEEWNVSTVRWYGPSNTYYKTYTTWDKNGDGRLDPSEFDVVVTETKLYNSWDVNADSTIESDEYAAATFRLYDLNNDGQLNMQEWKSAQ